VDVLLKGAKGVLSEVKYVYAKLFLDKMLKSGSGT
jgi:hypothetical protein